MIYAFKLSEITAMQLACIKQLNELKDKILDNRKTRGFNAKKASIVGMDVLADINKEIRQRKEWAMNPSLVRV